MDRDPNIKRPDGKYLDREWLREKYIEEGKTCAEIADECGSDKITINGKLRYFGIERRYKKLAESNVVTIRERYASGDDTLSELAEEYGIGESYVSEIVRGVCRKNDPGPIKGIDYDYPGRKAEDLDSLIADTLSDIREVEAVHCDLCPEDDNEVGVEDCDDWACVLTRVADHGSEFHGLSQYGPWIIDKQNESDSK